jgi:hypothetical protein
LLIDAHSETWLAVSGHCHQAITRATEILSEAGCPERDADYQRGILRQAQTILALENQPPIVQAETINNF